MKIKPGWEGIVLSGIMLLVALVLIMGLRLLFG